MDGRLYVIGDRETGVIFLKTDPLRVAIVSLDSIQQYATEDGISLSEAFAKVARGAKHRVFKADGSGTMPPDEELDAIADQVRAGTIVTDAEFCFISETQNVSWNDDRYRSSPISNVVKAIGPKTPPPTDHPLDVTLLDTSILERLDSHDCCGD